jgi:molybdenum cofactor guanylyltransferase
MLGGVIAAVLAGGAGRRMGGAKAQALLGGRPLVSRPLAAARAAGLEPVVVAKAGTALPALDVPVWVEPARPQHPLCGVAAALERAGGPVVALACDQPWLTGAALAAVAAATAPLAVPFADGRPEPFPGRYDPALLPALREALRREAPLRATLMELGAVPLDLRPHGDPAHLVASLNTPAALAAAEAELAGRVAAMSPTAEQWLDAFAAALGRPAPTPEERQALLELASVAAHASERKAAPIACWLAATAGVAPAEARARAQALGLEDPAG